MRSLSATLLAAQKQPSGRAYVKAEFTDHQGDRTRLRFTRHYTGSEGEYYGAVVGADDGSLIRARIDPTSKVLYTQRVVSPGPASDFSSWTSHGTVSASGAVALASSGASVFLFYVDTDTTTIRVKQSTDNGATYGSASTVATAASAVTYLAAAIASDGDRVLFWTVGAVVWKSRYTGGSWDTPAAWSNTVNSLTGIACRYFADWNVIVCGTETASLDPKVWACIYGDDGFQTLDTWTALSEMNTAAAASNVSFRSPALELLSCWRLFFVEKYTGSLAYSRLQWSTMDPAADFADQLWREPAAFAYPTTGSGQSTADYGVACASKNLGGYFWLSAPAGVWRAQSPANPDLEVTADVLEASVDQTEDNARVRIVLRNDAASGAAARYSAYGTGSLGALQRGTRLKLSPGYYTTAGAEASTGSGYWVESIEQVTGADARLVVHARDGWWLLEQWHARRQFTWAAGTSNVFAILLFICARAGLPCSTGDTTSSAITSLQPAFTIHPGESGKTAVRRLLAMVPDEAFFQSAMLMTRYPQASDASDYAYGAGHAIVAGRYRDSGAPSNRIRVLGAGVFNEGFDFAEAESVGERIAQVLDVNLTTTTQAGDRAAFALREAEVRERHDELQLAGVNCGQELYDVVSVTDAQVALTAAKRRVLGLTWRYSTDRPRYDMTLLLGSP